MKLLRTLCCTLLLLLVLSLSSGSASTLIATAPAITAYSQQVVARNHNRLYVPAAIPAVHTVYPAYATYPATAYNYPRYGYAYNYNYGYYPAYGYGYSYAGIPTTAVWR